MSTITWHRCTEQLHDDETTVLLAFDDGEVLVGYRDGDEWCFPGGICIGNDATHWAHFPEPPACA